MDVGLGDGMAGGGSALREACLRCVCGGLDAENKTHAGEILLDGIHGGETSPLRVAAALGVWRGDATMDGRLGGVGQI